MVTIVPADGKDGVCGMPLDTGGSNRAREFILMLVATLIEKMYLVGGGDGNGGINGNVGDSDPDDTLMVVPQVLDLSLGKETHRSAMIWNLNDRLWYGGSNGKIMAFWIRWIRRSENWIQYYLLLPRPWHLALRFLWFETLFPRHYHARARLSEHLLTLSSHHPLSCFISHNIPEAVRFDFESEGSDIAKRLLFEGRTILQLPFLFYWERILLRSSNVDSKLYFGPGLIVE